MHYDSRQVQRSGPSRMTNKFERFERLPAEIRNMIWEQALPEARVYEILDAPNAKHKTPAHQGLIFANVHHEPPPALSAVCRESRHYVLHTYKPLTLGSTTKYVDLSRDILLLEPYLLLKRLHRTLYFMSQIPLVRDSIGRLALGTSYGLYTGICHPVISWKVSKNNMSRLLAALGRFPRLKALIFIVHQEFQFEFDFRFPGMFAAPAHSTSGSLGVPHQQLPIPGSIVTPLSGPSHIAPPARYPSFGPGVSSALPSVAPAFLPGFMATLPAPLYQAPGLLNTIADTSSSLVPRPQQVHQAYRFKFDIEANINHTPRRPHLNELLYYPLDIDEDSDDWDLHDPAEGGEWCDPWPTNDDWRRFRRRFQRAINATLDGESKGTEKEGKAAACPYGDTSKREDCKASLSTEATPRVSIPALQGASLLWRYTRGGYV